MYRFAGDDALRITSSRLNGAPSFLRGDSYAVHGAESTSYVTQSSSGTDAIQRDDLVNIDMVTTPTDGAQSNQADLHATVRHSPP